MRVTSVGLLQVEDIFKAGRGVVIPASKWPTAKDDLEMDLIQMIKDQVANVRYVCICTYSRYTIHLCMIVLVKSEKQKYIESLSVRTGRELPLTKHDVGSQCRG